VIKASPTTGDAPLKVDFDGSDSYDPDVGDRIVSYEWDFGDGSTATGVMVSHTYTKSGAFTATLTITDNHGATGTDSVQIMVGPSALNHPPTVIISSPADGSRFTRGNSIYFTGSGYDPEDGALTGASLVWSSSIDGQIGIGKSFTRDDLSPGLHTITLTATDSQGASSTDSRRIFVCDAIYDEDLPGGTIQFKDGFFCLDGRIVINNGTLTISNSTIVFFKTPQSGLHRIDLEGDVSVQIDRSQVITSNGGAAIGAGNTALPNSICSPKGYIQGQITQSQLPDTVLDAAMHTSWDISDTEIQGIQTRVHWHTSCSDTEVRVVDSWVGELSIRFHGYAHTTTRISNLGPGYYSDWSFRRDAYAENHELDLTLLNTTIEAWSISIYGNEEFQCERCELSRIFMRDEGIAKLINTTVGSLELFSWAGSINAQDGVVDFLDYVRNSTGIIQGTVNFITKQNPDWLNSTISRKFPVEIRDSVGSPLAGISLELFSPSNQLVWLGASDLEGKAVFEITFDDDNFDKTWTLKAPDLGVEEKVRFLTNTPIVIMAP